MHPSQAGTFAASIHRIPQVSALVLSKAREHCEAFVHADPFKHVVIEDFLDPPFAERLLQEFPSFDTRLAVNEHGVVGNKSANANIREISPAYQELYDTISSQPFLDLASRLSGIPNLILDPKMHGGGTH